MVQEEREILEELRGLLYGPRRELLTWLGSRDIESLPATIVSYLEGHCPQWRTLRDTASFWTLLSTLAPAWTNCVPSVEVELMGVQCDVLYRFASGWGLAFLRVPRPVSPIDGQGKPMDTRLIEKYGLQWYLPRFSIRPWSHAIDSLRSLGIDCVFFGQVEGCEGWSWVSSPRRTESRLHRLELPALRLPPLPLIGTRVSAAQTGQERFDDWFGDELMLGVWRHFEIWEKGSTAKIRAGLEGTAALGKRISSLGRKARVGTAPARLAWLEKREKIWVVAKEGTMLGLLEHTVGAFPLSPRASDLCRHRAHRLATEIDP